MFDVAGRVLIQQRANMVGGDLAHILDDGLGY